MATVISARGLVKRFGELRAVDGLDLTVESNQIYGFLGPNGSGKTTTIRLLLGLLEADEGSASVMGVPVATRGDEVREACGSLLEHDGLYERMSVEANLELTGRIWRMNRQERERRTRELLEGFGLYGRRSEQVGSWSRGMKRKLAVARALFHRPRLVFLDEPTSGLDPVAAAELVEDLREIVASSGATVFLTTHNLAEAEKLCDRIGVLKQGRLVAEGAPDEIRGLAGGRRMEIVATGLTPTAADGVRTVPGVRTVECSRSGMTVVLDSDIDAAPIVRFLVHQGVDVEEVRKGSASLEEAFLTLVRNQGEEQYA